MSLKGAAIAQSIHLRLPSCHPGFEHTIHALLIYNQICAIYVPELWKRTKLNTKEAGFDQFCFKQNVFEGLC